MMATTRAPDPHAENNLDLAEKMEEFSPVVDGIAGGPALLDADFVLVLPLVGDGHEFAGQKGVDDGSEEDQGGRQVERFRQGAVFQDGNDPLVAGVLIAVEAERKGCRMDRGFRGRLGHFRDDGGGPHDKHY